MPAPYVRFGIVRKLAGGRQGANYCRAASPTPLLAWGGEHVPRPPLLGSRDGSGYAADCSLWRGARPGAGPTANGPLPALASCGLPLPAHTACVNQRRAGALGLPSNRLRRSSRQHSFRPSARRRRCGLPCAARPQRRLLPASAPLHRCFPCWPIQSAAHARRPALGAPPGKDRATGIDGPPLTLPIGPRQRNQPGSGQPTAPADQTGIPQPCSCALLAAATAACRLPAIGPGLSHPSTGRFAGSGCRNISTLPRAAPALAVGCSRPPALRKLAGHCPPAAGNRSTWPQRTPAMTRTGPRTAGGAQFWVSLAHVGERKRTSTYNKRGRPTLPPPRTLSLGRSPAMCLALPLKQRH